LVEKFDPDTGIWLPVGRSDGPEYNVDGLVPGHDYKFRVKAVNKEGESEPLETLGSIIAKDPFSKFKNSRNIKLYTSLHLLRRSNKAWSSRTYRLDCK